MNRRYIFGLSVVTTFGLALLPSDAVSQQNPLKEQLAGAWTQVSIDATSPDGTKRQLFGPNPKGIVTTQARATLLWCEHALTLPSWRPATARQPHRRKLKPWSQDRSPISADIRSMKQARSSLSTFREVHSQTKSAAPAITSELSLRSQRTN